MLIKILYNDNRFDMIKDFRLDEFISKGKVVKFQRSEGWVVVGKDPIRGTGGNYTGPERRQSIR